MVTDTGSTPYYAGAAQIFTFHKEIYGFIDNAI
jgi:hypothetical protein